MYSLRAVAAQSGFSYSWLAAEQAAAIERPGVVIVVRPGNQFYEVNDGSEFAGSAPRSAGSDILIPQRLVQRIRLLARAEGSAAIAQAATLSVGSAPLSGALSMTVTPVNGQEALFVSGSGPQSAPVTLTLLATVSREIPDVILSRDDLITGRDGKFSATLWIAPDFMRDTILTVRATSLDTVAPFQTHVLVGSPNPHVTVPAETLPPNF
ncbi:MAG: hypothetical protein NVS9B12_08800 [Vulcanimicrobiaceae bacterium]